MFDLTTRGLLTLSAALAIAVGAQAQEKKPVTAPEIPAMDISFIESMDGEGPQGAKGVGEAPAICIAAATASAIANATGVRITSLPFTPERVYRALRGALPAQRPSTRVAQA